jgi:hypothetical protein
MAHFAELDSNNVVLRVIVVGNADTADASGVEDESIGVAFCRRLFGGRWVQTSYNGNIRKNYAGIGHIYDATRDAFIAPKPENGSWVLNEQTCCWERPLPEPQDGKQYYWSEADQVWKEVSDTTSEAV